MNPRFHSTALAILNHFERERVSAFVIPTAQGRDPFLIEETCDHETIQESGGEIVCRHCGRIFWA
jgi:hypothetical protein